MSIRSGFSILLVAPLCCAIPTWAEKMSPEAEGKEIVDATCNSCHALKARVGSGYNA